MQVEYISLVYKIPI